MPIPESCKRPLYRRVWVENRGGTKLLNERQMEMLDDGLDELAERFSGSEPRLTSYVQGIQRLRRFLVKRKDPG